MNKLEKFGKVISQDLRDSALNRFLDIESGKLKSPSTQEMISRLSEFSDDQKSIIRTLLTECIDCGVHDLLFAIEEETEDISVHIDGTNIADESDGLNGEIFTEDGWFAKHSEHGENGI